MSQIRGDIMYNRRINELCETNQQIKHLHIATPIVLNNETETEEPDIIDDNWRVSDSEETNSQGEDSFNKEKELKNNNEIVESEEHELQWNNLIYEWINAIQKENQFDNNDDEIFLNREWDVDFRVGERQIHPADDSKAKWKLESLFIANLDEPVYLETDFNIFL